MISLSAAISIISIASIAISVGLVALRNKLWNSLVGSVAVMNAAFFVLGGLSLLDSRSSFTGAQLLGGLRNAFLALFLSAMLGIALSIASHDNNTLRFWTVLFFISFPLSAALSFAIFSTESSYPIQRIVYESTGIAGLALSLGAMAACAMTILRRRWTAMVWVSLAFLGLALSSFAQFVNQFPSLAGSIYLLFAIATATFSALTYEYQAKHLYLCYKGENKKALKVLERNLSTLNKQNMSFLRTLKISTLYRLAEIHHKAGRFDASMKYLDEMHMHKPGKSYGAACELLYAANLIMKNELLDEAKVRLENVLSTFTSPIAHLYLCYLHAIDGNEKQAKRALDDYTIASRQQICQEKFLVGGSIDKQQHLQRARIQYRQVAGKRPGSMT
ncbi:MAG: hypothetical protein HY779_00050 [Rubrobacteridae bacterium]|nr:hypothetical protein [Rubrobacteridae bacterium]